MSESGRAWTRWMRSNLGVIVFVGALALMLAGVIRTATADPPTRPRAAEVAKAERVETSVGGTPELVVERPEGDWIAGLGLVEPRSPENRLAPAVAGRIDVIHVKEGDFVEAGALILELESAPERAALASAEAEVGVASASLARSRRGLRQEDVDALTSDAQAAMTRAASSQASFERLRSAASGGGISRDEMERAERQAESDRLIAQTASSRQRAGLRGRQEDVLVAVAQLRAAEARREQARAMLDRLRMRAPVAGRVLEIHYRVGEYIMPGGMNAEPFMLLGDTRVLRARLDIDERDTAHARNGAKAMVVADGFPGQRFMGRVVEIGQRMGRKNLRTDDPVERIDTKILEVVVELEGQTPLVPGLRVRGYVERSK